MKFRALPLAILAISTAAPALASDPAPEAAQAAPAAPAEEKLICKRITDIGSRVSKKKVCMTAREWAANRASAQDFTRRAQRVQGATNGS